MGDRERRHLFIETAWILSRSKQPRELYFLSRGDTILTLLASIVLYVSAAVHALATRSLPLLTKQMVLLSAFWWRNWDWVRVCRSQSYKCQRQYTGKSLCRLRTELLYWLWGGRDDFHLGALMMFPQRGWHWTWALEKVECRCPEMLRLGNSLSRDPGMETWRRAKKMVEVTRQCPWSNSNRSNQGWGGAGN